MITTYPTTNEPIKGLS